MIELDPDGIAIVARSEEKQIAYTAYYNCNAEYKSILAFHLLSDIVTDIVKVNKEYIFEDDDDDDEDDDDV